MILLWTALGCAQKGPPNILLVSFDTVRADHLSVYGYARDTTPNLENLAKHGVVFEHAIAQGNESAYSHASLFTGLYASEIASPVYETYAVPQSATLLPEVLKLYGYETAAFVAGGHVTDGFGFDQGFDTFTAQIGFASFWDTLPPALDWLEGKHDKPWFMFLHSYDAHRPYMKPGPWNHLYDKASGSAVAEQIVSVANLSELVVDGKYYPDQKAQYFMHPSGDMILSTDTYDRIKQLKDTDGLKVTDEDRQHVQDHYDGALAYEDLLFGTFLAKAEDQGLLDNTVIVVVGDHGEDLLDHGYMNHRTGLYDSCIRVPTIVAGPGFPQGARIPGLVEANDVAATIYAIAGATPPTGTHGRDLREVAKGGGGPLDVVFSEGVMDMVSARTLTHKLVYHHAPLADPAYARKLASAPLDAEHFSLYDLTADPGEKDDLIKAGKGRDVAEALRGKLVAWRRSITLGTHSMDQSKVDPAVAEQMRKYGYWDAKPEGAGNGPPSPPRPTFGREPEGAPPRR